MLISGEWFLALGFQRNFVPFTSHSVQWENVVEGGLWSCYAPM